MPDPALQNRRPPGSPEVTGLPDERLLELFHAQNREDCFAELTRRYLDSAFRVAFARCGRRELAEEAVQEAFYRLSRKVSAPSRSASAPFKLRLFALVSISARNSLRAERRKAQRPGSQSSQRSVLALQSKALSESETREALARALVGIDEEQRVAIVLHFLEGLSQRQIGTLVGVAQSVVARRISVGLATLRSRLVQAGVSVGAQALPALLRLEGLLAAPESLWQELAKPTLWASPAQEFQATQPHPHPGRTASTFTTVLVPLAAVSLAMAVLAMAVVRDPMPAARSTPSPPPTPSHATPAGPAAPSGIDRTWDFQEAPPKDWALLEGEWHWVKGVGMEAGSSGFAHALIPLEAAEFPMRAELTLRWRSNTATTYSSILYTDGVLIPPRTLWPATLTTSKRQGMVLTAYLTQNEVFVQGDNGLLCLDEYETAQPGTRLCLTCKNVIVRKVTLRSISEKELPASEEEWKRFKKKRGTGIAQAAHRFNKDQLPPR